MLSPIGYVVPGMVIDMILIIADRTQVDGRLAMTLANMCGAAAAGLTANAIVFHLSGVLLALYVSVALVSGAICGALGYSLVARLRPIILAETGGRIMSEDRENAANKKQAA